MKLVYFAWVRERIGIKDEEVALPADVATAGELPRVAEAARTGIRTRLVRAARHPRRHRSRAQRPRDSRSPAPAR